MLIENKINFFKINQKGFTLIELLLVSLVSIILLGLIAGIFQSQTGIFTRELNQGTMEANGRSVIDFLSRGVQNAGYNISRGSRFLAASDHYMSLVFDEDDDDVIQNDEIFTYAVSNTTESISSSFSISPFFDFDDNGRGDQNETRDYEIELSLSSPPFNLYLFTPNKNDGTSLKNIAARNIDNLIIRYYDKNDDALPEGVNIDVNGSPIPPYTLSSAELNKVRKVEFEVVVRSKDEDSRENYVNNGSYLSGSVAVRDGDSLYSDRYRRNTFKAVSSPRNLITAAFGKVILSANPDPINCPDSQTIVTASVVDSEGESISEELLMRFNSSDGVISPETAFIDEGEVSVALNYDWSSASITTTVSASTEVDQDGKNIAVFNAIPITFDGKFLDDFDLGPKSSWSDVKFNPTNSRRWEAENGKYQLKSSGDSQVNLNGCSQLQNYDVVVNVQKTSNHNTDDFFSLIVRSQASNEGGIPLDYYSAEVVCFSCDGEESNSHRYLFRLVKRNGKKQLVNTLVSINLEPEEFPFDTDEDYSLKVSVADDKLIAKFWKSIEPEPADDPDEAEEPDDTLEVESNGRAITASSIELSRGNFGLSTNTNKNNFDNVVLF